MSNETQESLSKLETLEHSSIENSNEVQPVELSKNEEVASEASFEHVEYSRCPCTSGCGSNYSISGNCPCTSSCGSNYRK